MKSDWGGVGFALLEQEPSPDEVGRHYLADKPGGVYVGPGLWQGCFFVMPASAIVALVSALAVALTSRDTNLALVGLGALGGLVAGVVAWVGLWELFVRLHPRFSTGIGRSVKYVVVLFGPLIVVCAVAVSIALKP